MALKPKAVATTDPLRFAQWKKPDAGRRQTSASGIVLSFTNDVNGRIADRRSWPQILASSTFVPAPRRIHQKYDSRVPSCSSEAKGDRARECSISAPFPPPAFYLRVLSLLLNKAEKIKQTQACRRTPIYLNRDQRAYFHALAASVLQSCGLCAFSTEFESQAKSSIVRGGGSKVFVGICQAEFEGACRRGSAGWRKTALHGRPAGPRP